MTLCLKPLYGNIVGLYVVYGGLTGTQMIILKPSRPVKANLIGLKTPTQVSCSSCDVVLLK